MLLSMAHSLFILQKQSNK